MPEMDSTGVPHGLYETLVTEELQSLLADAPRRSVLAGLSAAEAPDRIVFHLTRHLERALASVGEDQRVSVGVKVARALLLQLADLMGTTPEALPVDPAAVLKAVLRTQPDGSVEPLAPPLTPLLDTTLLTNAPGEPTLWAQLRSEIASADRIDLVMAFIRRSGIAPLREELRRHCERGRSLRVLTTTYTGSTERRAVDDLVDLGADVRVSYDLAATRLHAKAWVFHRDSGYSTAYVGSSNLTHSAQERGVEWNVRASGQRNPDLVAKFGAVFDAYWASGDFRAYDADEFDAETRRADPTATGPRVILSPIELRPRPFQERLLELLEVSRQKGHHRNLLVAATGTGKTVMAALDYAGLAARLPRARLLFIAHRFEILDQSMATFRYALRSPTFGEIWARGSRPERFEHVFASIQSLHHADLESLPADHFDVVIVDEFHHAAASSYTRILDHVRPAELVGLTATPERSDGLPLLHWFGDRIAAELRLWDAIDQQYLAPFLYFGIHDGTDLTHVPWKRGRGYDLSALSDVYTSSEAWARLVVHEVSTHVDVGTMRCLGFCVSVEQAQFMADRFTHHGIPAVAISGASPAGVRSAALDGLARGDVRAVFSVDVFNEGVDVPDIDTVLMLRPTESPVLFLQQLGRGLRRSPGKGFCTVLDFVGVHRTEFRFDRRYRALIGGTRRELESAVKAGFPYLPSGCSLQLDPVAADIVLRSIRQAIPSTWAAKRDELRALATAGGPVTLAGFLHESGLDLDDVYDTRRGWSDLQEAAGLPTLPRGPHEERLRRGVGRLLDVDDQERIETYRHLVGRPEPPDVETLPERQRRLLRMLLAVVADQALTTQQTLHDAANVLWAHPQVLAEIAQLMDVLAPSVSHLHRRLTTHPDAPLAVHARYSRPEMLAAMGAGPERAKTPTWREGVHHVKDAHADLLAFTLDKTGAGFSPTTRYRDYAVSRTLIHWESQSTTSADSPTGRRYQEHQSMGHQILLFARLRRSDRSFWFLGPATYRGHTGSRPMAVTWELETPLPGDLYASFAAAVA